MSKKTRFLAIIGFAATGVVALTSCVGGSQNTPTPVGEVGGDISYGFWGNQSRADRVGTVIEQFEAATPDAFVKPEFTDYASYVERLTVRAAGEDLACSTGMQSQFFARYAEGGVLRELDDLVESGLIDTSEISDEVLAAGQIDGTQYMIPTGTFARIMAYNEDLAAAAGVDLPSDDFTWDDWADWLRELQPQLPEGTYATENIGGDILTFTAWVVGHGEEMFTDDGLGFDEELMEEFFRYWIDLADEGVALPPSSLSEQATSLELTPLALGRAAAGARDIQQLYDVEQALLGAGLPSTLAPLSMPSESDASANVLGANGITIPQNCDNVATAAAFINFFTNDPEATLAFQSSNGVVSNATAQEALLEDPATDEGVKQAIQTMRSFVEAGDVTTSTYPMGFGTATRELERLYQAAAFGDLSVEDAVAEFFASVSSDLD